MSWTLSVSDLNEYVRRSLAGDPMLRDISLRGEISSFRRHVSGHWYFTLKDADSRINCVMFRASTLRVHFAPADGMKVVLKGAVGLYTQSGSYQFYADDMTQDGIGELYLKLEQLKARLMKEGLFDVSRKKTLPLLPRTVGIVTSRTGAVVHDIATVSRRRNPSVQLILRPAQVQGEGAAEDIARGIEEMARYSGADVLIIGRGGGSLEDLWAFNEEVVVRAIAACPIPVISAVGHEVDVTLSDFAADQRAATPSAAAELAVPEREALRGTVDDLMSMLIKCASGTLMARRENLMRLEKRMTALHPVNRLASMRRENEVLCSTMSRMLEKRVSQLQTTLRGLSEKLSVLGPRQALKRGYVIARTGKQAVVRLEQAPQNMELLFADGRAQVHVTEKMRGDPFADEEDAETGDL